MAIAYIGAMFNLKRRRRASHVSLCSKKRRNCKRSWTTRRFCNRMGDAGPGDPMGVPFIGPESKVIVRWESPTPAHSAEGGLPSQQSSDHHCLNNRVICRATYMVQNASIVRPFRMLGPMPALLILLEPSRWFGAGTLRFLAIY